VSVPAPVPVPVYLVPYEEKTKTFSKIKVNKYITFKIDQEKQSIGLITNTFGNVDDIEAYTNYQLHVNGLNSSLSPLNKVLKDKPLHPVLKPLYPVPLHPVPLHPVPLHPVPLHPVPLHPVPLHESGIEDRRTWQIISIDPEGCTDIDDAIGLNQDETLLSIYIANVPLLLEKFNLWSFLSERISTIYLKDRKIPMLPPLLSDDQCSLLQGQDRLAFVLDIHLDAQTKSILKYSQQAVLIRVEKNYVYEANELLARSDYQTMLKLAQQLNNKFVYVGGNIKDSHELIEFCMILMNYECSQVLQSKNRGIFRSACKNEDISQTDIPAECKHILQNIVGEYCSVSNVKPHELIGGGGGLPTYVHITSPIRRLVDCLNMLEMQKDTLIKSPEAQEFLAKWLDKIPELNAKNKSIRRLQNEVELLHLYQTQSQQVYSEQVYSEQVYSQQVYSQQVYSGMVFAQTPANENAFFKYRVYIPVIKCLTSVYSLKDIKNYTFANFTLHWFLDESKMQKKIRLQML